MAPKIEKLCGNFKLGEAPFWDEATQILYFVDINGHTINKYNPVTKQHTSAFVGKNVSIIIPVKGKQDQFVITLERELVLVTWDAQQTQSYKKDIKTSENVVKTYT